MSDNTEITDLKSHADPSRDGELELPIPSTPTGESYTAFANPILNAVMRIVEHNQDALSEDELLEMQRSMSELRKVFELGEQVKAMVAGSFSLMDEVSRLDEIGHAQEHMLAHLTSRLGGCVYISEDNMYSIDCDEYQVMKILEDEDGENGVAIFFRSRFEEDAVRAWVRDYIAGREPLMNPPADHSSDPG